MRIRHLTPFVAAFVIAASVHGDGQESFPTIPFSSGDRISDPANRQDPRRQDSSTPVFRSKVEAIAVDVFVTDAEGAPVSGLTVDDFELEEAGKPQEITTFQAVDISHAFSSTDFPPTEPDVASNDRPEGRIYVFAFGARDAAQALRTRAFLRTFIERYFGPYDIAAVVQLGKGLATDGQDFTGNRRLIRQAIDKLSGGFTEDDPRVLTQALDETVAVLGRMPGRHKSLLYFNTSPGYPWGDLIDYNGYGTGCIGGSTAAVPQLGCFGEKVSRLIFDDAHRAMSIATRNNITIYPINPAGLTGDGVLAAPDFRALAEITGGFAHINSNDFDGAFERIVRDASTYYMLGFNSDYKNVDGKYVGLKVRVKRPDLTVRTRTGYVSTNRSEYEASLKTRASREPVVAALAEPVATPGHPVRVTAAPFKGVNGNAAVVLTIETGLVSATRQPRAGERSGSVQIRYLATDAKRRIYPEFRHQTTLSMPVAQADSADNRVRLVSEIELPEGRYQLRVASGADRSSGGVVYDLEVPDFSSQPLTMSGLTVAAAATQSLPTVQAVHDKKKIKTRTCREGQCVSADVREVPLVPFSPSSLDPTHPLHNALPAPPTTMREFRQSETVTVFAEIYDNKPARPLRVVAELKQPNQPAVLNVSHEVAVDKPRASGGHGVTLTMPLATVPPGSYVLQVEARAGDSNHVTSRQIAIRVR